MVVLLLLLSLVWVLVAWFQPRFGWHDWEWQAVWAAGRWGRQLHHGDCSRAW